MCVAAQTDKTSIDISRGFSTIFGNVWSATVSAWLQAEAKILSIKSTCRSQVRSFKGPVRIDRCGLRNIRQTVSENAYDLSAYARKNHEIKAGAMGHMPCSRLSRSSPVSSEPTSASRGRTWSTTQMSIARRTFAGDVSSAGPSMQSKTLFT